MKLPKRRLVNWLTSLGELTQETETPAHFWIWSGLYTLSSAMQRKTWLEYGFDKLLPNLYIFLVAPPGKCRKGAPVSMAKKLLSEVKCTVGVDSSTKPSLTRELSQCTAVEALPSGEFMTHSSMALVSKELSSLMIDLKNMVECLTDLYDTHEVWEYKTKGAGKDEIYGPCLGVFAATTPSWITNNLPYEAIGDGFFSRIVVVTGDSKRKRVARPRLTTQQEALYRDLVHDLGIVNQLKGPFEWTEAAKLTFDKWYSGIDSLYGMVEDERFHGTVERVHVQVLKVAMALHVSASNDLTLTEDDILMAVELVESLLPDLGEAFVGIGRSEFAQDIDLLMRLFREKKTLTIEEIHRFSYRNLKGREIEEVLEQLLDMGEIKKVPLATQGPLGGVQVYEKI